MVKLGVTVYSVSMIHSGSQLSLSFESHWGTFSIDPEPQHENIFKLSLSQPGEEARELGFYCSISDAVSAVAQQQTGHPEWDQIPPMELPNRVHNIACWNFQQKMGTFSRAACS